MDGVINAAPETFYEADFHAWAVRQAALLRAGRFAELDAALLAEEIEELGASEYRSLESALRVLLMHMLKWDYQPARRSRGWAASITVQRMQALAVLQDNPSLKSRRERALVRAYAYARVEAAGETDLPLAKFPEMLPYDWTVITERPFSLD